MKKFFMLMAVASMGVMANAQSVEELQVKAAEIQSQLDNYDDGIAKKWEFRFDLMGETNFAKDENKQGVLPWEEALGGNLGVGYNFNSNFYAGIATGYYHKIGSSKTSTAPSYIPALLDLTYRWNLGEKEKWSFFLQARGGYCFGITGNEKVRGKDYEYPNALTFDVQPGIYYRIKPNMDLKFSIGYAHISPDDDTPDMLRSTNMLMAKVGMNFRKASKMPARSALLAEAALVAEQLEAARLAAEEAARQAALKAQEEAARKAAAEAAAKKAAEEEAARLAALEAAKHQNVTLFYEIRLSDLTAEHNAQLDELVQWVNSRKIDKIVVKGYADRETGNPRLNAGYAKSRAEKVKKALIKKYKIDKNMIECSSYGDTEQPFNENVKNRCTIILVNEID